MTVFLIVIAIVGGAIGAAAFQRRSARLRGIGKGMFVSFVTIVLLLAAGEAYFRYVHADSEGRKASNNWIERYWHTNSHGFRDREWTSEDWSGKTTVAVVGDSLTAGWGINDPADRFSDVLAERLGSEYAVFNLGIPGSSTPQELVTLQTSPNSMPDVVILQYFLNDAEYAALTAGFSIPQQDPPVLAQESYFADYLFSRFSAGFGADYWATEYGYYDHATIWAAHEAELNAFADYVKNIGARLIVVIFPNLQDPVGSIAYADRVAQVFEARGITDILRLYDAAAARAPAEVSVSPRDAHPSVAFHHLVGDMLYEQFFAPAGNA